MLDIILLDDNKQVLETLSDQLYNLYGKDIKIGTYSKTVTVVDDIREGHIVPDIAIFDIKVGEDDGIELAGRIKKALPLCQIIFMSGFDDFYLDVYEVEHIYFLKKPLDIKLVSKALLKAKEHLEKDAGEVFSFSSNRRSFAVRMKEIVYFEKDRRKMILYTTGGQSYEFYDTMETVIEQLSSDFIRCHNSYIVNMQHAERQGATEFAMDDGREIPISRSYSKMAKASFADFLSRRI